MKTPIESSNKAPSGQESFLDQCDRLLFKLSPYRWALKHLNLPRTKAIQKAVKIVMAAILVMNVPVSPVHAYDPSLTPEQLQAQQPTMTLEQMQQSTQAPTAPPATVDEFGDAFLYASPLSSPTPETQALTTTPTFYVSKTGSDQGDGSSANPWSSIQFAVNQLQPGDTLSIMEGTYVEEIDLKTNGTAAAPITIQGIGNVVIDGTDIYDFAPIFETKGFDYYTFKNLTVNNARAAVEVSPGSSFIEIDGLRTNNNHFAVKINSGTNITVRNVVATNSRNAFRTENNGGIVPSNILFENIEARGSKDIYPGYESKYRNGDGFILEAGNNITVRNAISADNWDAGFDIKANNVLIENVISTGNKNNFKIWGSGIVVKNALSHNAKIFVGDPVAGEGNGVNARMGSVTFINSTFVDNEAFDIKVDNDGGPANVTFQNSVIARKTSSGQMFTNLGGSFTDKNNVWYWQGHSNPGFTINSSSFWGNPQFTNWDGKDFHLTSSSPAINFGNTGFNIASTDLDGNQRIEGESVDSGAYEFGGTVVPPATPVFTGVQEGGTASGTINVSLDGTSVTDAVSVKYSLDGTDLGTKTTAPFMQSIDTTQYAQGAHILSGIVTRTGGVTVPFTINFTVDNITDPTPDPTAAFEEISGSLTMEGENHFGSTTVAGQSWQVANSTGNSNGKVLKAGPEQGKVVNTADGPRADYKMYFNTPGTYYVWLRGFAQDGGSDSLHVGLNGQMVTGGNRVSGFLFDGSASSWASKNMDGTRVSFTVTQPGEQTLNLWMREDSLMIDKIVVTKDAAFVPQGMGPVESGRRAAPTPVPVFQGLTADSTVSGTVNVSLDPTSVPDAVSVEYSLDGVVRATVTTAPFTHAINTVALANGTHVLSGRVKRVSGELIPFTINFSVNNVTTPTVTPIPGVLGVGLNQEVSGTVQIRPDLNTLPGVRKVAYYLNGNKSGKVYQSPFMWGGVNGNGSQGFDTKTLADGTYTLAMVYTDATGDHTIPITFKVNNTNPTPTCTTQDICGIPTGTVSGVIKAGPNLTKYPSIRKVSYYLNGTQSGKVYQSPYFWGGPTGNGTGGFDTRTLANGTYTLAMVYTDSTGDHEKTISFTVLN